MLPSGDQFGWQSRGPLGEHRSYLALQRIDVNLLCEFKNDPAAVWRPARVTNAERIIYVDQFLFVRAVSVDNPEMIHKRIGDLRAVG